MSKFFLKNMLHCCN